MGLLCPFPSRSQAVPFRPLLRCLQGSRDTQVSKASALLPTLCPVLCSVGSEECRQEPTHELLLTALGHPHRRVPGEGWAYMPFPQGGVLLQRFHTPPLPPQELHTLLWAQPGPPVAVTKPEPRGVFTGHPAPPASALRIQPLVPEPHEDYTPPSPSSADPLPYINCFIFSCLLSKKQKPGRNIPTWIGWEGVAMENGIKSSQGTAKPSTLR